MGHKCIGECNLLFAIAGPKVFYISKRTAVIFWRHTPAGAKRREIMSTKILLVDDDRNMLVPMEMVLRQKYEVVSAFSGEEGLARCWLTWRQKNAGPGTG
jgi:hypothetical protein